MRSGTIQQLIYVLKTAFDGLHADVPAQELESIAISIHKTMSVEARHFHTPEHVLGLVDNDNPHQSLAALFHDIVYYQVDRGFSSEGCAVISSHFTEQDAEPFVIKETDPPDALYPKDRPFHMALDIFGFSIGDALCPECSLNEFVSALVMCRRLRGLIQEKDLLKIIVYIAGTVPFQGKDEQGRSPFEILEARLRQACDTYGIAMSPSEIEATIQGAVVFANKDVENFTESDPARFLDNTWKLLPETNIALRLGGAYSVRDYRQALQKMYNFLCILDPGNVFHCYKGIPPQDLYQNMLACARYNIQIARQYLGIKLLTISVLEALAEVTGGDAPVSLFMGDMQRRSADELGLEDFLPPIEPCCDIDPASDIFRLLETGRGSQLYFDMKNSPVSLFMYKSLGDHGVQEYLVAAREMFSGKLSAQAFLDHMDSDVLSAIAGACAKIVITRSDKLKKYIASKSSVTLHP
jgi:hypothetical protein